MLKHLLTLCLLMCACTVGAQGERPPRMHDLSLAVIVVPTALNGSEHKAIALLVEEVQKRTQIRWSLRTTWPEEDVPVIAVGQISAFTKFAPDYAPLLESDPKKRKAEGYQLRVTQNVKSPNTPVVLVGGNDARGVLFGIGRLLRTLRLDRRQITLTADLNITTAPRSRIRGHQLGYRPKTNSYDAWDVPMWEQYIRDLAVFGANSVELIPPRSDDAPDSPHFPLPQMEMMVEMSRLLDEYGLDCWIWYPAMDTDYSDPKTVELALKEWGEVFRKLPRIDAVFVPGGDPGHTPPKYLMALLEKETEVLHRTHPKAQMWVAPQGFTQAWMEEFLSILHKDQPKWLTGVVFGPQVRMPLPELRKLVPAQYPIRHYPDITHNIICQYPVQDWDVAYAVTEGRESINPRPIAQSQIIRRLQKYTEGSISYSEGCNDDVNKAIWSALEWDPDTSLVEVLRDYSRYFIGARYTETFAEGLLALERNWQSPVIANDGVFTTLQQFQAMERTATPFEKRNWRFQQALYRAYYDAYVRARLLYEQGLEERALQVLDGAVKSGSLSAMHDAEVILIKATTEPVAAGWRARVFELAEALFQSVRMQLSVERYGAIGLERGANLDAIDVPLNNREWLKKQFAEIRQLPSEEERQKRVTELVHWTDPGPGGFYDEPGNLARRDHLVMEGGFANDPGGFETTRVAFSYLEGRLQWKRHIEVLYDRSLTMHYPHLDPHASYRLRVVYGGNDGRTVRLMTGDGIEIHPLLAKPLTGKPMEFDIPPPATAKGELTLIWSREKGQGGNGRGCMLSEVWLLRK